MDTSVLGNRYELIEKIGGGGMAVVYKARCRLLNRYVAVKVLREEFTGDEEFVKRFEIEAQSAASLSHPNIVPIYDVGNENNVYYIVMEYVDGITLKEYIAEKGPLEWKEAIRIATQICSAIEHAHIKKIIHRDIKPQNILVTKEGIAKVTDFGIARAATSSTITMVGTTIGSVHYFSPEQARGGYIDEKSDLYSLGIVLYEMVTGRMPFDGESPVAIALMHIQDKPVPPTELNKDIPKALNDIIIKAIRKEQSNRYQSASEMLEDLYRALREPYGSFAEDNGEEESPTRKIKAINGREIGEENDDDSMARDKGISTRRIVINKNNRKGEEEGKEEEEDYEGDDEYDTQQGKKGMAKKKGGKKGEKASIMLA
ncbi:MAG: Stk1 family PASTA domain-containing Ser/Thr kinase, partial [Clostridiaceae bacterium]|nr:Stk1 family PASTA domain-containing Ser/Thr kinase [Clostridiaceae bacterium]